MAEELEKLKAIRGAYKGHCTKNEEIAEQIMSDHDPDIEELQNILESYTLRLEKISLIDQKIEALVDAGEVADEITHVLDYGDKTLAKKNKMTNFLHRQNSQQIGSREQRSIPALPNINRRVGFGSPIFQNQGNNPEEGGLYDATSPSSQTSSGLVKLPKMILKPYTGDPLEWTAFWESFEAAVDSNQRISNVEKMNYLKNYLKGDAERAIRGFSLSNDNYHSAVRLLKERFGQKQTLINAYMKALWNIPSATTDVKRLRDFYDSLEAYIRGLESLEITSDGFGPLLLPVLLERLPEEIRRELLRRSENMDLEAMREFLRKEIETREKSVVGTVEKRNSNYKEKKDTFSGYASPVGSAAEMFTTTDGRSRYCVYCGKDHMAERCLLVTSLEKRTEILRKQGRCFNCLRRNHMLRKCRSVSRCSKCDGKHHDSICRGKRDHNAEEEKINLDKKDKKNGNEEKNYAGQLFNNASRIHHKDTIMLQTASILVTSQCGTKRIRARVLFDMGAQRSFITRRFASRLECQVIGKEMLSVSSFGTDSTSVEEFDTVEVGLVSATNEVNIDVLVTKTVSAPIKMNVDEEWLKQPEFEDLKFADNLQDGFINVDILIGNDHYGFLMTGNLIKKEGVIVMESIFGWMISGPVKYAEKNENRYSCLKVAVTSIDNNTLNQSLKQLWEINSFEDKENDEDRDVMKKFKETIRFDHTEGRYCVRWLWKRPSIQLPQNLNLSKRRLRSLVKKLRREGRLKEYDKVLKENCANRYIEEVKNPDHHQGIIHYLPHFAVIKEESLTTKLRIVYDVSAKSSKDMPSMNEELFAGPSLLSELVLIFIKFCLYPVALVADVEKAFLQILLDEQDRDTTRFLWLKDINGDVTENNLEYWRFRVVLFGATPSPFLMNATFQYHLDNYDDWVAEAVADSLYSDNLVGGADDDEEGLLYNIRSREIFSEAGMNLRNWMTNSTRLKDRFKQDTLNEQIKVLGMLWDTYSDVIQIAFDGLVKFAANIQEITKRVFCAIVSKLFDPPGYLEPYVIRGKMIMQELWKLQLGWDDVVPDVSRKAAEEWIKEVDDIKHLKISRRSFTCKIKEIQQLELHVFSDSSERAYGAVCYLRVTTPNGVEVKHVLAKSRIAPIKTKTIPRLELMAAVLATNMMNKVITMLSKIIQRPSVIFWCDSEIVLHWILGKDVADGFVRRRIETIKSVSKDCEWRYVPSKMNPADVISRGCTVNTLVDSEWDKGPLWLKDMNSWPDATFNEKYVKSTLKDLNNATFIQEIEEQIHVHLNVMKTPQTLMSNVMELKRYSSLNQLLRVTAMVFRFISNSRSKVRTTGRINSDEKAEAMKKWLRCVQNEEFKDEKVSLKATKQKSPPLVSQLRLYLDNYELIRCKGRLENAFLPDEVNCPVLLPKNSWLTKLVILDAHHRVHHSGVRATLTDIRQRFWIIHGRKTVNNVIRKCVPCLKLNGKAYQTDVLPPLPAVRVSEGLPFRYTGTDFAGPLFVKMPRRKDTYLKKVYICLFTCAVIRAIHLEVVEDLTVHAFLRAFRRFISRRGIPELVISDNAQTFKAAAESLSCYSREIMATSAVQDFMFNKGIKWNFIVERAPWWGGFYERLVGSVKRCLKKVIGKALLSFEEMQTIIPEVEAVINSRPMTYLYSDIEDGCPLTPSHFLCGRRLLTLPDCTKERSTDPDPDYVPEGSMKQIVKSYFLINNKLKIFWNCWKKEYLVNLREFDQKSKKKIKSTPTVGEVTILQDQTPRSQWKLCRIEELFPGKDGVVRAVKVRMSNGNILRRPIQHVYPLEIYENDDDLTTKVRVENESNDRKDKEELQKVTDSNAYRQSYHPKSKRKAAYLATQKISEQLDT